LKLREADRLSQPGHCAATLSNTAAKPCPPPDAHGLESVGARRAGGAPAPASPASGRRFALTGCPSEMPEPCTLVRSRSASVNPHFAQSRPAPARRNASLSSMTFHVGQGQPGSRQRPPRSRAPGRSPITFRRHPGDTTHDTSRTSGRRPSSAAPLPVVVDDAHGGGVVSARWEFARGDGGLRILAQQYGFEPAQRFHRGVGARVLVRVDHPRRPLRLAQR